jgi:deoxyribodipyrimidine photo-lyase
LGLQIDKAPLPERAWLLQPWSLRAPPAGRVVVGVFDAGFHAAWPWSAARWRFVAARMAALAPRCVWLQQPPPADAQAWEEAHLRGRWALRDTVPVPRLFADPASRCGSFSQFWKLVGGL